MHSLTKYMNGHSDVIMGAAMTNDDDVHTRLRFLQNGKFGDYSFYLKKKNAFNVWLSVLEIYDGDQLLDLFRRLSIVSWSTAV